jgi:hypothetical protein
MLSVPVNDAPSHARPPPSFTTIEFVSARVAPVSTPMVLCMPPPWAVTLVSVPDAPALITMTAPPLSATSVLSLTSAVAASPRAETNTSQLSPLNVLPVTVRLVAPDAETLAIAEPPRGPAMLSVKTLSATVSVPVFAIAPPVQTNGPSGQKVETGCVRLPVKMLSATASVPWLRIAPPTPPPGPVALVNVSPRTSSVAPASTMRCARRLSRPCRRR